MRPPLFVRRITRCLLRRPEKVLVALCAAFICFSMLILVKSSGSASDDRYAMGYHELGSSRRPSLRTRHPEDPEDQGSDDTQLAGLEKKLEGKLDRRAGGRHQGLEVEANTAARLEELERQLRAMDERLAAATSASPATIATSTTSESRSAAPASAADPLLATQMATLSQQVAAVLSIVALDKQRAPAPAQPAIPPATPLPTPPPPPPFPQPQWPQTWEASNKMEEFKQQVKKDAQEAAKSELQEELGKMRKTIERLSRQSNDRYAQVLRDLRFTTEVPSGTQAGFAVQNVSDSPAQATGHGCRSPPCSRDLESCKHNGNCCIDFMYEMLVDFSAYLTSRNVTHYVVAGTLLGGVRDKDIIPETSDIDMVIPREGWEKARQINHVQGRARSYYFMPDPDEPHCARLCAVWEGLPVNHASFSKHFDWDTDKLAADIQYYMDIYDEDMDFAKKLKHLHYPLSSVVIRNHSFPAPRDKELWVEAKYGSTWRTPDHQSHGGRVPYPTLDEAKSWSEGMLTLAKVRTNAMLAHRLLDRAHVDYKTGQIVMDQVSLQVSAPGVQADHVKLEGFLIAPGGSVMNGSVVVWPPHDKEGEITHYVLYWAAEKINGWELKLEHLGEKLATVSRCSTGGDPFKACSQHGLPLHAPLPRNATVPDKATHLLVIAANEGGEAQEGQSAELLGDKPGGADALYTRRVQLGLLQGLAADVPSVASCVKGVSARRYRGTELVASQSPDSQHDTDDTATSTASETSVASTTTEQHYLSKDLIEERVVQIMIRKTKDDMRHALIELAKLLQPSVHMLRSCSKMQHVARKVAASLDRALSRISKPTSFAYEPGKVLDIDNITVFLGINHAISELRRDQPQAFGSHLGELLKPLGEAPADTTSMSTTQSISSVGSNILQAANATKEQAAVGQHTVQPGSEESQTTSSLPKEEEASTLSPAKKDDHATEMPDRKDAHHKVHIPSSRVGLGAPE